MNVGKFNLGYDYVHLLEGGYGTARLYPLIDWDALKATVPGEVGRCMISMD